MNNKLTDEKIKARINAIEDRRSASRDFWDGDWDYPEDIELLALRELQERRKADNQEPAGYHVVRECGKVGCSVATLEEVKKTRDFWNKKWTISPYFYTAQPAPVAPDAMDLQTCHLDGVNETYAEGWNDCRDAMLNSAKLNETVSETNKLNSPATPDCWIPVSNQLPEKGQRLIAFVEFNSNVVTPLIKDAEYTGSTFRIGPNTVNTAGEPRVTHWIPLPNPPQQ